MGKGAGGCDDRPAFAISGAVLVGEQSTIELSPYGKLMMHRETFPGNNMLQLGTPADLSESDRIRFRRMVKDLEGSGEVVQTWEQSRDEPTVTFVHAYSPHWTQQGSFQRYDQLHINVNGEGEEQVDRINLVQQAMQQHGFYAVVTFDQTLQPSGQALSNGSVMDEGQILQMECNGTFYHKYGTIQNIEDETEVTRAIEVFTIEGMQYVDNDEQIEWLESKMNPEEIVGWMKLDLDNVDWAQNWTDAGFDLDTATEWINEAGWYRDDPSSAAVFHAACIPPQRARRLYELDLEPADEHLFEESQWQEFEAALAGYNEEGNNWYGQENIQRLVAEYRDDPDNPLMERDLQWIEAGFDVYRWSGKETPWDTWKGCTPEEAKAYKQAGYHEPPADAKVLQVTRTWQKACPDLSLDGPAIEELIAQGIKPKDFQQARKIIGDDDYTKEAFSVGWALSEMVEWKDTLRAQSWRTDRVRELQQVGATPVEANLFFEAGVDVKHYQTFKDVFGSK